MKRSSLLPVIVHRVAHLLQDMRASYSEDARIDYVKRFGDYLSDEVVCLVEDAEYIRRVEGETGKKVIPLISMGTWPKDDTPLGLDGHFSGPGMVMPLAYEPDGPSRKYIEFIEQNQARFPHVLIANNGAEMYGPGGPDRFNFGLLMEQCEQRFPALAGKMMFSPPDTAVERDAFEMMQTGAPTATWKSLRERQSPLLIFTGFTFLYESIEQIAAAAGYTERIINEYSFFALASGPFPYAHLKTYFQGFPAYAGIGFARGAKRHHLKRLQDLGLTGCLFFAPAVESAESNQAMEDYLTDVI